MAKRYSFPEPACMECRHHQYLGNGLTRSRYCGGFPKRKSPKRFRSSDPQRKAPKWCPRRISPPVCRVYGFADERSQAMDIYLGIVLIPRRSGIFPLPPAITSCFWKNRLA